MSKHIDILHTPKTKGLDSENGGVPKPGDLDTAGFGFPPGKHRNSYHSFRQRETAGFRGFKLMEINDRNLFSRHRFVFRGPSVSLWGGVDPL